MLEAPPSMHGIRNRKRLSTIVVRHVQMFSRVATAAWNEMFRSAYHVPGGKVTSTAAYKTEGLRRQARQASGVVADAQTDEISARNLLTGLFAAMKL
jgi:hypothetical protein